MYLKTKVIFMILLLLLTSCVRVIEDPVKKYNTEFLQNNSMKISRAKRKHLALARQQGIMYRENGTDAVDSSYYRTFNGTNLRKKYRNKSDNYSKEEKQQKNIKYLDDDLSIYYRQRNLKDNDDFIIVDNNREQLVFFLAENYPDYSKEKISFEDIEPTSERLYGNIKLRKEKEYKSIDAQNMQEDFDYLDIMNRVKKEMYLENKRQQELDRPSAVKRGINTIRDRFMSLFR